MNSHIMPFPQNNIDDYSIPLYTTAGSSTQPSFLVSVPTDVATWYWGDGNTTEETNTPAEHTFTGGASVHIVSVSDIDPVLVTELNISNEPMVNNVTVSQFSNITSIVMPQIGAPVISGLSASTSLESIDISNSFVNTLDISNSLSISHIDIHGSNVADLVIDQSVTNISYVNAQNSFLNSAGVENLVNTIYGSSTVGGYLNLLGIPGIITPDMYFKITDLVNSKFWVILHEPVSVINFSTTAQYDIVPGLLASDSSVASWWWGDGNSTAGNNSPLHTYTDGLSSHIVGVYNINALVVTELHVFSSFITKIDISQAINLHTVAVNDNLLEQSYLDAIIINLDNNGVIGGTLNYDGNPQGPSNAACSAYNNLISKGWGILGDPPFGCVLIP